MSARHTSTPKGRFMLRADSIRPYSPTEKLLPFNEPLCCVSWQLVCPCNPYGTPPEAINTSGGNVFFN